MTLSKIPESDAQVFVRALGLLVGQAGIYGPSHKVTQDAAQSVFAEIEQAISRHGAVELTLREQELLVNGQSVDAGGSSARNVIDRMAMHKIGGLLFQQPASMPEFLSCITLFASQPSALAAGGGFEAALKKAALRSIRVVSVAYQRVLEGEGKKATGVVEDRPDRPEAAARRASQSEGASNVLDLSEETPGSWEEVFSGLAAPPAAKGTGGALWKQQASSLAELLREAATRIEEAGDPGPFGRQPDIAGVLKGVRDLVSKMAAGSEQQISTLAGQVESDWQTIASIESSARESGVGLQLTRAELIARYAEINQEIVQPLTVSTGVIDLLNSERTGALTDSQRQLLKLASDSVARVNQLVGYLNRISGLPEGLTPDAKILKDSYR